MIAAPTREGATNGLEYTLELKKVRIGKVETAEITIQALPTKESETSTTGGGSGGSGKTKMPKIPNYNTNPYDDTKKVMTNKRRSWAKSLFNPK